MAILTTKLVTGKSRCCQTFHFPTSYIPKDICVYSVWCKSSFGIHVMCCSIFRIIRLETGMEDIMEYSCAVLQVLKVPFFCISTMLFQVCPAFLTRRQTLITSRTSSTGRVIWLKQYCGINIWNSLELPSVLYFSSVLPSFGLQSY